MDTKMKELVCVAPDGSLEVWEQVLHPSLTWCIQAGDQRTPKETYLDYIDIVDNYFERRPEFWGREVLGEL